MLEGYDDKFGALKCTDIRVSIKIDDNYDTIISHSSVEFDTNGHMHCTNLADGMKLLVEYYLEHLIWKYEEQGRTTEVKGE